MYWPEIFCLKALVLSACMYVMVFQDQLTLPKWNILSDQIKYIAFSLACIQAERIFHFMRVWSSWKIITYIWAERTRALRQNISGQCIHTSRENAIHINISMKLYKIRFPVTSQKSLFHHLCVTLMKTSNIRVLDNFPKPFPKPKSITFIPS